MIPSTAPRMMAFQVVIWLSAAAESPTPGDGASTTSAADSAAVALAGWVGAKVRVRRSAATMTMAPASNDRPRTGCD
ncbi:unannotated protein [freshwater metagenome]|uniref:Unannotated protein n=1 Tax=freshwater metagenome TaxID=449393 RepID=A0A6J6IP32_9ZZZZ